MAEWFESLQASEDPCFKALCRDSGLDLASQLSAGRLVTERFHWGRTLLHIAAELGATRCADVLLAHEADIEALTISGESALMEAIGFCKAETARLLLQRGARIRYQWSPEDNLEIRYALHSQYKTLFDEAAEKLRTTLPFEIEEREMEIDLPSEMVELSIGDREINAIELCHDAQTLRLLVEEYGCEVNHHDGAGYWPLKLFAEKGESDAVGFLLAHGADPNFTSTGETALHGAVLTNSPECVRLLLKSGANANQRDVDLMVPMHRVSSQAILDILLEYGADPTIGDQCGFPPSHWVKEPSLKARLLALERSRET